MRTLLASGLENMCAFLRWRRGESASVRTEHAWTIRATERLGPLAAPDAVALGVYALIVANGLAGLPRVKKVTEKDTQAIERIESLPKPRV